MIEMAKLKLCFAEPEPRQLTTDEINELAIAAHGIGAMARVMVQYAMNNPNGEPDDSLGVFCAAFNVLEWLIEPIDDYLFSYAGEAAAEPPEKADGKQEV
jgi:hypothetical protein